MSSGCRCHGNRLGKPKQTTESAGENFSLFFFLPLAEVKVFGMSKGDSNT